MKMFGPVPPRFRPYHNNCSAVKSFPTLSRQIKVVIYASIQYTEGSIPPHCNNRAIKKILDLLKKQDFLEKNNDLSKVSFEEENEAKNVGCQDLDISDSSTFSINRLLLSLSSTVDVKAQCSENKSENEGIEVIVRMNILHQSQRIQGTKKDIQRKENK